MVTFAETAEPFIKPAPRARAHVRSCTPSRSQQSNFNPAITLRSSLSKVRTRLGSCSKDPIGYLDGNNLYTYVRSKPLDFRDPSGNATGIWNKFCEACRGAYEVGPFDACGAAGIFGCGIGSDAQDFANTFDDPGERNAARHCYWQAMLTLHYGEGSAEDIGDAHEYGEDGNSDSIVDQFNNPIGRRIGSHLAARRYLCGDWAYHVEDRCTRAVRDGTLATSPDDPRLPTSTGGGSSSGSGDSSSGGTSS